MQKSVRLAAASLAIVALLLGCSSSDDHATDGSGDDSTVAADVRSMDEPCLTDFSYRAVFAETDPATGDTLTDLFHEVSGDQLRIEASNGLGMLVLGREAWTYGNGEWTELPARPVRPLRVPWVNNFITGQELVNGFGHVDVDDLTAGETIAARVYQPPLPEMIEAFGDRFADREYDPSTSTFEYWIDACDDVVFADITLTFAGEDAEFATDADIPLTLRYTYKPYDVGGDIAEAQPSTALAPIARPTS